MKRELHMMHGNHGVMECWSIGLLRILRLPSLHHSITPILHVLLFLLVIGHWSLVICSSSHAAEPTREEFDFFENHVRPVLVERCVKCHGATKQESGLRLDSHAVTMRGGDSGAAVVAGKPDTSLLVQAIRYDGDIQMPPDGKLEDTQIAALVKWIEMGAPWPDGLAVESVGAKVRGGPITDAELAFWSFQPIRDPAPPAVKDGSWIKNDLDRFVLARLEEAQLAPVRFADKRTLIGRASFDLIGLPPTPAEVQAFLADDSTDAWAKLIDRLLESKAYGERWGRHWLDVVRYADTAGETADYPVREAYLYRNWVINAFNVDKPYDKFIREQIAGDLLAERSAGISPKEFEQLVTATGFIAISRRFGFDPENYHDFTIQDTLDTLGQAVLGLSLGCAHCHDHKYDPINREDYYAWFGIFESTRYSYPGSESSQRPRDFAPVVSLTETDRRQKAFDAELVRLNEDVKQLTDEQQRLNEQASAASDASATEKEKRNARLNEIAQQLTDATRRRDEHAKRGAYRVVYGVVEGEPHNAQMRIRGERQRFGEETPRRNLEILGGDLLPTDERGSGRLQLADWLTRPDNPLTARVMVNRIWQHHFGSGLVRTEHDFGARGERPTHPELLDWLAARFIESGWSVKAMHRLIMQSATYQLDSHADASSGAAAQEAPEAKRLWRFNRRRLSAEELRDAMLFISGDLDPTMGGEHPFPPVEQWGFTQHAPFYGIYETNRRSIYLMQQRLKRHPFLALFDGADPNVSTAKRTLTTVPTQALYLMNDPFVHERSNSFADRLIAEGKSEAEQIRRAYEWTVTRPPSDEEVKNGGQFLAAYRNELQSSGVPADQHEAAALAGFVRTMFVRNEFLFVD